MKLKINGKQFTAEEGSLSVVLKNLSFDLDYKAIALNWKCIPKTQWEETKLQDGDEIEIISPQAGG